MVTSTLEPVLAALFAFLIVGEQLAAPQVAGMAAVIAAIVLLSHT
jgi:drug/metabolite transporter (DMT)-like permease